jgi:hypothetical protein
MRFFEFHGEDKLVLILKNVIGRSSSKGQPARLNWEAINSILKRMGQEQLDYDAFKNIYDRSAILQNLVHDFNADGLALNVPGSRDQDMGQETNPQDSEEKVAQIAASNAEKQLKAQA